MFARLSLPSCWLSRNYGVIWSYAGPVAFVLTVSIDVRFLIPAPSRCDAAVTRRQYSVSKVKEHPHIFFVFLHYLYSADDEHYRRHRNDRTMRCSTIEYVK